MFVYLKQNVASQSKNLPTSAKRRAVKHARHDDAVSAFIEFLGQGRSLGLGVSCKLRDPLKTAFDALAAPIIEANDR